MLIFHIVKHVVEGVETSVHVAYDAPQNCDIVQLIHDAALDYLIATHRIDDEVTGMSYMDFIQHVPNEFCERYGFRKLILDDVAKSSNGESLCFTPHEARRQLRDHQRATYQHIALHKAFSAFGRRMEPALRKSTAMADWTFHQVTKQMLEWSEEFAAMDVDPYGHFERNFVSEKLDLVRRAEQMEPPEEAVEQNQ